MAGLAMVTLILVLAVVVEELEVVELAAAQELLS
jgi:hypothetical protein